MLFDVGRKMRKISNSFGARDLMVPFCLAEFPMQLFPLHPLARMRMIEIHKDDATMTIETVTAIEEIKGAVEVVVVVDKSSGTKTKVRPVSPVSSLT